MDPTAAHRYPDHGASQEIATQAGPEHAGTGPAPSVGGSGGLVTLKITITEASTEQSWGLQGRRPQLRVS
jgi:hypothetical protein